MDPVLEVYKNRIPMIARDWPWRTLPVEDNPADEKSVRMALERNIANFVLVAIDDRKQACDLIERIDRGEQTPAPIWSLSISRCLAEPGRRSFRKFVRASAVAGCRSCS
jgi:hypothetical protein